MTLIRQARGPNPLKGFTISGAQMRRVGRDLQRPECILAQRDGVLWSADARGGVMHIAPDGSQRLVAPGRDPHFDLQGDAAQSLQTGTLPNGLAFAADGDFLIANFGTDRLERMTREGERTVLRDSLDGRPLGKVNFVLRDRKDRLWITVSTRMNPWGAAVRSGLADGYIVLMDERGARVVADGLAFANEVRLDAQEAWLYVAETTAKRVTRFRVGENGDLASREVYGPSNLGDGMIDGIAFDVYGNLWATMIFADRLVAIAPEGELLELMNDGDPAAIAAFEAAFATGDVVPFDLQLACGGPTCPWLASVTFGGPDLKTVHLGGLRATDIPTFQSPVAGVPMVHW